MADIINVILTTEICEDEPFEEFHRILFPHEETGLVSCTDKRFDPPWWGGDKHLEVEIYLGAFREFDVERAIMALRQASWTDPESVKLFICRGRDQRFTEVVWRDPADVAADDDEED